MRTLLPGCLVGLVIALGCSSSGKIGVVQSEYWKNEDFSQYKRYAWIPSDGQQRRETQPDEHKLHSLIREALDRQLGSRGFVKTRGEEANFLVTYHCKVARAMRSEVIDKTWYEVGDGTQYFEPVTPRVELSLSEFEEGSIVVDFVNPRESQRMWRGVARGRVSQDASSDELSEMVDDAVSEILDEFPPPAR